MDIEHILSLHYAGKCAVADVSAGRIFNRTKCDASRARQREAFEDRPKQEASAESIRQSCPMTGQRLLLAGPAHPACRRFRIAQEKARGKQSSRVRTLHKHPADVQVNARRKFR